MNKFTEKLFKFFSTFIIIKIITIFAVFTNINCGNSMSLLFEEPVRKITRNNPVILENANEIHEVANRGILDNMGRLYILKLQEFNGAIIDAISGIPFKNNRSHATFIRDDYIYIAGFTRPDLYLGWAKINKNDLTYDAGYGTGGYHIEESPGVEPKNLYVNSIGEAYIGGFKSNASTVGFILKLTSTGEVDTNWANNGEILYSDVGFPGSQDYILYILANNSELVVIGETEVMINSAPYKRMFLHVGHEKYML